MARESPVGRWAVYEHPDGSKVEIGTVFYVRSRGKVRFKYLTVLTTPPGCKGLEPVGIPMETGKVGEADRPLADLEFVSEEEALDVIGQLFDRVQAHSVETLRRRWSAS